MTAGRWGRPPSLGRLNVLSRTPQDAAGGGFLPRRPQILYLRRGSAHDRPGERADGDPCHGHREDERGKERGEVRADLDSTTAAHALMGSFIFAYLSNGRPKPGWSEHVVDTLWPAFAACP